MGSLTPSLGRIVIVATPEGYNGALVQPGIITRVWNTDSQARSGCMGLINVKVLPDLNVPFDRASIYLYHSEADAHADTSVGDTLKCWWPERT